MDARVKWLTEVVRSSLASELCVPPPASSDEGAAARAPDGDEASSSSNNNNNDTNALEFPPEVASAVRALLDDAVPHCLFFWTETVLEHVPIGAAGDCSLFVVLLYEKL